MSLILPTKCDVCSKEIPISLDRLHQVLPSMADWLHGWQIHWICEHHPPVAGGHVMKINLAEDELENPCDSCQKDCDKEFTTRFKCQYLSAIFSKAYEVKWCFHGKEKDGREYHRARMGLIQLH